MADEGVVGGGAIEVTASLVTDGNGAEAVRELGQDAKAALQESFASPIAGPKVDMGSSLAGLDEWAAQAKAKLESAFDSVVLRAPEMPVPNVAQVQNAVAEVQRLQESVARNPVTTGDRATQYIQRGLAGGATPQDLLNTPTARALGVTAEQIKELGAVVQRTTGELTSFGPVLAKSDLTRAGNLQGFGPAALRADPAAQIEGTNLLKAQVGELVGIFDQSGKRLAVNNADLDGFSTALREATIAVEAGVTRPGGRGGGGFLAAAGGGGDDNNGRRLAGYSASGGDPSSVGGGFASGFIGSKSGNPLASDAEFLGAIARYQLAYSVIYKTSDLLHRMVEQAKETDDAIVQLGVAFQATGSDASQADDQVNKLSDSLANSATAAGYSPAVGIAAGAQGVQAFGPTGSAAQEQVAKVSAQTAATAGVLTGQDPILALHQVTAATLAFNLGAEGQTRVLDAATNSWKHYGGSIQDVLTALPNVAEVASQAGLSIEQTSNLVALIGQRTGQGDAASGTALARILSQLQTPAGAKVEAQLGVSSAGTQAQQLQELADKWNTLSQAQQSADARAVTGSRGMSALLAILRDGGKALGDNASAFEAAGSSEEEYYRKLGTLGGQIKIIGGDFQSLIRELDRSGLATPFEAAFVAIHPLLSALDALLHQLNELDTLGGHFTLGRDLAVGAAEIFAAIKLFGGLNIGGIGTRLAGGRGVPAVAEASLESGAAAGADASAESSIAPAAVATTDALAVLTEAARAASVAVEENTVAGRAATAARVELETAAAEASAAANLQNAAATEADTVAKIRSAIANSTVGLAASSVAGRAGIIAGAEVGLGAKAIGAAVTIALVHELYRAGSSTFGATRAGEDASRSAFSDLNSSDPASLEDRARLLAKRRVDAQQKSGGFFGRIENYVGAAEGRVESAVGLTGPQSVNPETSGDVASRLQVQGTLLQTEADRARAAQQVAAKAGDYTGFINLNKPGGVEEGLKSLTEQGLDSSQQLAVLNQKLAEFAQAANNSATYIAQGSAKLLAQNYANAATNDLVQSGGKFGSKDFQKNIAPGLNDAISSAADDYLSSLQGQNFTSDNGRTLEKIQEQVITAYLKAHGFSAEDLSKAASEIHGAAGAAVQQAVAQANASHGQKISLDAVAGVVDALQQNVSNAVQEQTTKAQLGQVVAPQGTAVAGLQAGLDYAQETLQSLQASGADPARIQKVVDQINALKVPLNQAILANIDAQDQLLAASIPPENQTQQIQAAIKDVQDQLAVAVDPDAILKLQTELAKDQQQLLASQAQDRISAIGVHDNPADSVRQAQDAYLKAKATVSDYRQRGVIGAALNNAEAAANQAHYAYVQADLANAIALNDAAVPLGDKVGEALAKWQDLVATARTQVGGQKAATLRQAQQAYLDFLNDQADQANALAGAAIDPRNTVAVDRQKTRNDQTHLAILRRQSPSDTIDIANLEAQVRQDRIDQAKAALDVANAATTAGVDPGDALGQADAQLRIAIRNLRHDLPGTQQYYQDLAALKAAQLADAQAQVDRQNAALGAGTSPGDSVGGASAQLREAENQLRIDKEGTTKYYQDLKAVHDAQYALAQAQTQLFADQQAASASGFAASIDPADQVASAEAQIVAANAQIASARNALSKDKQGTDQYYKDLTALNQGQASLKQAQAGLAQAISQAAATASLLGSDVTDPIAQAQAAVVAAETKLSQDRRRGGDLVTIQADELALSQATWGRQKAIFDEQLNLEQEKYQNYEITSAQYLQYLQGEKGALTAQLAGMKEGSAGYYQIQQELEQINSDIISANNSASGQFNLGSIKLPSVYEVRRALTSGLTTILSQGVDGLSPESTFGLSQTAASAIDPLQSAINGIDTSTAVSQLQALQSVIDSLTGASGGSAPGGTTNNTVIHAATVAAVSQVVNTMLGSGAVQRTGLSPKKVR